MTPPLFTPLDLRSITLKNRIAMSPMCQYSAQDGFANEWHTVHLGSRAAGGAGLIIAEATAVEARGRISPQDLGIWSDAHVPALKAVTTAIKTGGAVAGIQLAHAGRKASTYRPWESRRGAVHKSEGGWTPVGPTATPFSSEYATPTALSEKDIQTITQSFVDATTRALQAGFEVIEIHAAHGYLLHSFLSPLSNTREDAYGGSFENRTRFLRDVVTEVRKVLPETLPLLVRISATDWHEDGWTIDDSVHLATSLQPLGVDLLDCSSGGIIPDVRIPVNAHYQVPLAARVKQDAGMRAGAVGLITDPNAANDIIKNEQADLVLLGRELLRDPYWPLHASQALGANRDIWPVQYQRAVQ